jgi:hypothetical protein
MSFSTGIACIFYILASSWHFIALGLIVQNLCLVYQPALLSMMIDFLPPEKRGFRLQPQNRHHQPRLSSGTHHRCSFSSFERPFCLASTAFSPVSGGCFAVVRGRFAEGFRTHREGSLISEQTIIELRRCSVRRAQAGKQNFPPKAKILILNLRRKQIK